MDTFTIAGKKLTLFKSAYSQFERQIELPFILDYIYRFNHQRMLEIGNCLSNIDVKGHTVIDKYEIANGVINEDALTYKTANKYDMIVSISTIEHIGHDEGLSDYATRLKLIATFSNIVNNLLNDHNSRFVFTIPLGYNLPLDRMLLSKSNILNLSEAHYIRQSSLSVWKETNLEDATTAKYNEPFPAGNVILFGEIER